MGRSFNWAPQSCPAYGQPTPASWVNISINKWQQKDHENWDNYAHNAHRFWPILFNQNVEYVSYHFWNFNVPVGDSFSITHRNGTATYDNNNRPPDPAGPFLTKTTSGHTGATYLEHEWTANDADNDQGYKIDYLLLNCLSDPIQPANTTFVQRNRGYNGVLLGTDDVIWVWTVQPQGKEMSILLWPENPAPGTDLDLFLSVDPAKTLPNPNDPSSYTHLSAASGTIPELILLDAPQSGDRNVYIAVGSWNGSSQFRFYANVHAPGHAQQLNVRTDFPPLNPQHMATIRNQLRMIAQAQYFATDGRHFIKRFDLYWTPMSNPPQPFINYSGVNGNSDPTCWSGPNVLNGEWCKIDFRYINFTANSWCGNNCEPAANPLCSCEGSQVFNHEFAANVGAHELGHCFYGLPDEYNWFYACGHSTMRFGGEGMNMVDYCDAINGGKNVPPPWYYIAHPSNQNNWACIESNFPSEPAYPFEYTPDPFYDTCDQSDPLNPFERWVDIVEHWP